jgi:hypothetical protein
VREEATISAVARRLNTQWNVAKRWITRYDLDTSHFDNGLASKRAAAKRRAARERQEAA